MDDRRIEDVVRSIASGSLVDWDTLDTSPADASMNEVLRELQVIAEIAHVHGTAATNATAETPLDTLRSSQTRTWGPLTILERIGQGVFGDVYRAHEDRLDRAVALKLIPDTADDHRATSIVHEARLLARLGHPNVATVFGAERLDGHVGIWMELVPGRNLEQLLDEHGPLAPNDVCEIGLQLCAALAAVHRAGVLHRDIKATNVRRTDEGRIVLLDFGSGRDMLAESSSKALVGTPLYLAPEILAGSPATRQSDIYSVGVLLYHLLSGSYPVSGKTLADLRQAHASKRMPHLRDTRPATPRRLAAVIERAMYASPEARFTTADEMQSALHAVRAFPRRLAMAASAFGIAAVTALTVWGLVPPGRGFAPDTTATSGWLRARQLNWSFNWAQLGAISPDGRLLSYADGNTGNLAVLDLEAGATRLLTNDGWDRAFATYSVFSPDSQRIAFTWHGNACQCKEVRELDLPTGHQRVLIRREALDDVSLGDWSHDGQFLLATMYEKDTPAGDLELVSVRDGARRTLKPGASGAAVFSPDDRFVAYTRADSPRNPRDIHVLDLTTLADHALISGPADDGDLFWMGDHVVFSSNRGDKRALWSVRVIDGRASAEPALLTDLIEPGFWRIGLTTAGALYYGAPEGGSHVYTADLARDGAVSVPTRVTTATDPELSPQWSPDGRMLVWQSRPRIDGLAAATMRLRDLTTGRDREITPVFRVGQNPRWSPQGTSMLVRGADDKGDALRLIDAETGMLVGSYLQDRAIGDAEWTRDGSGAFYMDVKRALIGRLDLPSGADQVVYQLPRGQTLGRGLALSPNGQWIATHVAHRDLHSIIRIPVAGGSTTTLFTLQPPDYFRLQEWTADGRHLLFTRSRQIQGSVAAQEWQLWSIGADGGQPRYLNLSMPDLGSVRPSPDGRRLVFTSSDSRNRIRVLENLLTALRSTR
jgi:Tol biopolymer transport system component